MKSDFLRIKTADIYISVPEEEEAAKEFWGPLQVINQGKGGLGDRLCFIYTNLKKRYDKIIFMGADSPQFGFDDYIKWIEQTKGSSKSLIGPALDGGFYLFSSGEILDESLWLDIEYSTEKTCSDLEAGLTKRKMNVSFLDKSFDVDNLKDINMLLEHLEESDFKKQVSQYFADFID